MRSPIPAAAFVALVIAVHPVAAAAADGKTMTGSACQARQPAELQFLIRSNNSGLRSTGSQTVFVVCPVTKDVASGRIKRAEISVVDLNPLADVGCELSTNRSDGNVQQLQALRSSGATTAVQKLIFGGQAAVPNSSYNIVCFLPPFLVTQGSSAIISYTVIEE